MTEDILAKISNELCSKHGCHSILLYGSRARGEGNGSSDYDILAIRHGSAEELHDGRNFEGAYVDAFIVSEQDIERKSKDDPAFIRFRHGRVLCEKDGWASKLVEAATERFRAGPKELTMPERQALKMWVAKMLARIAQGGPDDVEANYRRSWLHYELLEIYFKLRDRWYLGPKESFAWLKEHDHTAYALFELALEPNASRGALRRLAEKVIEI